MTRRRDELRRRSLDQLLYAAGEMMDRDAINAVEEMNRIQEASGSFEIWFSPHHGWVIKDLSKQ
jgi:hypothetical protein